jgi:hypothetical protein
LEAAVFTNDGVEIGTVVEVATADDGEMVIIVAVEEGAIEGVDRLAVRVTSVIPESTLDRANNNAADGRYVFLATEWRVVIQTDAADLRTSVVAVAPAAPAAPPAGPAPG